VGDLAAGMTTSGEVLRDVFGGRRVLVTGHTGFKGGWLVHWLHGLGAQVSGIGLDPDTAPDLFTVSRVADRLRADVRLDIRDGKALGEAVAALRPEIVFHLAAQPIVLASYDDPVGTFATNVMGTVHLLDAVRRTPSVKACVVVTSDKCYENREWDWGYRENDPMGGHDPYSASKGASELVVSSYQRSFFKGDGTAWVASCRAGNVIGGGDWAANRLVPDAMRALARGEALVVRNPGSIRPWQHVLEPLAGYLEIAAGLWADGARHAESWNFGPEPENARTAADLSDAIVATWGHGARWIDRGVPGAPHEAKFLRLACEKARSRLAWRPRWGFERTVAETVRWYERFHAGDDGQALCDAQIAAYVAT